MEIIWKRIEGWRSSLLSAGGRLILKKHVLTSIPIYTLSCLPIPKGVHTIMERHLAHFSGVARIKVIRNIVWSKLCRATDKGGFGMLSLRDLQVTSRMK